MHGRCKRHVRRAHPNKLALVIRGLVRRPQRCRALHVVCDFQRRNRIQCAAAATTIAAAATAASAATAAASAAAAALPKRLKPGALRLSFGAFAEDGVVGRLRLSVDREDLRRDECASCAPIKYELVLLVRRDRRICCRS